MRPLHKIADWVRIHPDTVALGHEACGVIDDVFPDVTDVECECRFEWWKAEFDFFDFGASVEMVRVNGRLLVLAHSP